MKNECSTKNIYLCTRIFTDLQVLGPLFLRIGKGCYYYAAPLSVRLILRMK
jgi:hypothetical protein